MRPAEGSRTVSIRGVEYAASPQLALAVRRLVRERNQAWDELATLRALAADGRTVHFRAVPTRFEWKGGDYDSK